MKKQPLVSMLLGSALFGSALIATAQTADYERGRQLYENHCTSCHESQVHIREHAKVRSMTDLRYQIQRWRMNWNCPGPPKTSKTCNIT